ncbi:phosphoadenosine phosphosulfate reductase domain-containing protein [Acidithiobacillus ferriphilus]|uniref:phosphoadenosine phosphosulfate reductase domain-containing protein n=1 Tax=Acidithiobacillus ferriphilus TaxID=1689834 RepID=UPI001C065F63|nr:phosphoadenosine phosphosulfate reductase family protein [Acidithiobacillus ferriphilus]MBU2853003.1 phosphoadenosine phosphosulfate reductase family protein [Acidithiobacillus ferriphilus]
MAIQIITNGTVSIQTGKTLHVVGLSGGKDSTATLLLAIDKVGIDRVLPVFADTGNEHPQTYEYLKHLEAQLGISIMRVKPDFTEEFKRKRKFISEDRRTKRNKFGTKLRWSNKAKRRALLVLYPTGNPFLDLCMLNGQFPTNKTRFCTETLKRDLFVEMVDEIVQANKGNKVVVWQGVRRDESAKRADARKFSRVIRGFYNFRPLITWSVDDVFKCIADHGIQPNPLYASDLSRVGCAPCIYSNKPDLRVLFSGADGQDIIEKIEEWEFLVSSASKKGRAAFFQGRELAGTKKNTVSELVFWDRHKIGNIVKWVTKPGQFKAGDWDALEVAGSCQMALGLCE